MLLLLLAGCAAPAPAQDVRLDVVVQPIVLYPGATLEAAATVTNHGPAAVVLVAECSDIADLRIEGPGGGRLGAAPASCAEREPNVLAAGASAQHDVSWPAAFWEKHPEAAPGDYLVRATSAWRPAGGGDDVPLAATAAFRWVGHD